ncbi:uncharacterized protein EAE98_009421 [Botrytis deweyae]|uniref:NAD(P)-binding domain-containing protein n=1 Tax=Botrytis deweyae TaxID=2478750 RepID=A0ABQ7IBB7_9HELO|nr:uncharacterized protein EAE98_009421 [Botrytis deweyae]KAF7919101.1 hypothetical protein EAE98_009421 [Botrytis deweyae]
MLMKPWHVTSVIRDQRQEAEILQILKEVKANCIVFAAGNMSNVNVVGRNAVKETVQEFVGCPEVTKFLMISFLPRAERRRLEIMEAKLNADKYLVAMAKQRNDDDQSSFQAISLRPSLLTNAPRGKIHLGKTRFSGRVPRADVTAIASSLLSRSDTSGWSDLVDGNDDIESGVDNAVQNNLNSIKGEDLERINREAR